MKKFGARFSFSDFHGQKFSLQQEPGLTEKITEQMISSCVPIVENRIVFLNETTYSKIVL